MAEMEVKSYWLDSAALSRYPALDRDVRVDVVVVGAGITGLTAAYLLKRAGRTVAVIDRLRAGGVDSMYTTAHVTYVTDDDLTDLVANFGRDHAQAVWDAGRAGLEQIDTLVREEDIDCAWTRVTGYKYVAATGDPAKEIDHLKAEAALAADLGFDAHDVDRVPVFGRPGIAFADQGKFHPRKYLAHLAQAIHGDGSFIFEHTSCDEVVDEPLAVKAGDFTLACTDLVLATHTPLMGKANLASATLLQTKLYLYTSYVVGGRLPAGTLPEALFWDTADPYHYIRVDAHRDFDYVIVGGEDHKTGQVEATSDHYRRLEETATGWFPGLELTHKWSGQVVETNDGLPFIGQTAAHQFAATGYAGNGMTFGTLAGMMARDAILGLANPWRELFDVGRTKVKGGAWDYLKENVDYPYYMVKDRLTSAEGTSLAAVKRGEGRILEIEGQRVAASRAENGKLTVLSPVCTHMGCLVTWNDAEGTWDCPCHGSRFKTNGDVLSGPAEAPLEPITLKSAKSKG